MKIKGDFNKISQKLKESIPALKPGEVVTFQMLNGVPNPDPDENEKRKNPIVYGRVQVPTNDRIYDKWQLNSEGKEVGGYVSIGAVKFFDGDKPEFIFHYPGMGHHVFMGKFSLTGGRIDDEELYEFLMLSNLNESNPNRDKSVPALFKVVNAISDSKASMSKVATLRKAINIAADITEEDARKLAASLNWNDFKDWTVLKSEVEQFASRKPDEFLAAYDDPNAETKAILKSALDNKVIEYDMATGDVKMGASLLTNIASSPNILSDIFAWQQTAKNGEQVLAGIKKQLGKKKTELAL